MSPLYSAIARSMGSRYLVYAIQFASLMLLARWFSPETFGVIAAAQVFYIFFQLVAEGGLGPAIIGLDSMPERQRDGIFGATILVGTGLCAVFLALSSALAEFYQLPKLATVVPFVAAGIAFGAFSILPVALLQRQQRFLQLGIAGAAAELASLAVVFTARDRIGPEHALALRIPTVAVVTFCVTYFYSAETDFGRPRPRANFVAVYPLLRVSSYQLAFNILNFFSRNLDNVLVGKYLGATLLGIYDRSYQLMRYPLQLLTFAMTPAIQPVLRQHVREPHVVRPIHDKLAFRISLLGVAAGSAMYLMAPLIVSLAFGDQWSAAVPVIMILALSIPVQVVLSTSGAFFQTFQRTDLLFVCGLFSSATNVTAIFLGIAQGSLETLCWALFVSFHINFLQAYFTLYVYVFGEGFTRFITRMIPAALCLAGLLGWHFTRQSA